MWWLSIKDRKELEKLAKEKYKKKQFENVKKEINKDIDTFIDKIDLNIGAKNTKKLVASGWNELVFKIEKIKKVYESFEERKLKEEDITKEEELVIKKETVIVENEIEYFKSEADELIFYILELSGRKRNEKLKIEERFYKDKKSAKKWRANILKKIHPDISKNIKANEAIEEFKQLCRIVLDE